MENGDPAKMGLPPSDPVLLECPGDAPPLGCGNLDAEHVHRIAQLLLPGLATACVDSTTGGLFRSPATVAVETRRELVDYITQRSETYVAESLAQDPAVDPTQVEEPPEHPADIVSDLLEDFAGLKRNFFSRVSSWLLSDSREDKIDDAVQQMERKGFWVIDRRESVAEMLLKNLDFKNEYHCSMTFNSPVELADHQPVCGFRTMDCENRGCRAKFCATRASKHDSDCPYKVLRCEQNCDASIVRLEMDRHCITVCPMRLMNCPFFQVGCQSAFPQCTLEHHCSDFIQAHLLYIFQAIHKNESSSDKLKQRIQLLEKTFGLYFQQALNRQNRTAVTGSQGAIAMPGYQIPYISR